MNLTVKTSLESLLNPETTRHRRWKRRLVRFQTKVERLERLLTFVLTWFNSDPRLVPLRIELFRNFKTLASDMGMREAISHNKMMRLHFTRYLSGAPLLTKTTVSINPGGMPKLIWKHIKDLDWKDPSRLRAIMSILSFPRALYLEAVLDTSTIVAPWQGSIPGITQREFHHVTNSMGIKRWRWEWTGYHYSSKKGPNDQAINSAFTDLRYISETLKRALALAGGRYLGKGMSKLESATVNGLTMREFWLAAFPHKDRGLTRKLSYFSDKEGKTRVIAIFDYWSQTVLLPLHNHLNGILKRLKTDCTFDQNKFLTVLHSPIGSYHSLDLTAATDRMPLSLQKMIMDKIVGPEKTDAWAEILCGTEFSSPVGPVRYATGQPMGAYSSWPVMAITHHFITRLAALRCGLPHFSNYALLGDDIVIGHDGVAAQYRQILSTLAMPISEQKTHVSLDTYEFAKRWIQKGVEVSPFALGGLLETWKSYPLLHNFLENQRHHGWDMKILGKSERDFLSELYKFLGKSSQAKRTEKLYHSYTLLTTFIDSQSTKDSEVMQTCAEQLFDMWTLPHPEGFTLVEFTSLMIRHQMVLQGIQDKDLLLKSQSTYAKRMMAKVKEFFGDGLGPVNLVRRLLGEYGPLSGAFTALSHKYTEDLMKIEFGTDEEVREIFHSRTLAGSAFDLSIFSLRASRSKIYSESRIVKDWVNGMKIHFHQNKTDKIPTEFKLRGSESLEKRKRDLAARMARKSVPIELRIPLGSDLKE